MTSDHNKPWAPEREETLRLLMAAGLSASVIAAQMGGGLTRNAVLGKAYRLGICKSKPFAVTEEDKPERKSRRAEERPAPSLATVPVRRELPVPPIVRYTAPTPVKLKGKRITLLHLSDKTCKWPIGDPRDADFCFCGHEPREGSPYCEYHARKAYQPAFERRRDRAIDEAAA